MFFERFKLLKILSVIFLILILIPGCQSSNIIDDSEEDEIEESFIISGQILDLDEEPFQNYDGIRIKALGTDNDYILRGEEGDIGDDGSWEINVDERVSVEIASDNYNFISVDYENISSKRTDIDFYGEPAGVDIPEYYDLNLNQNEFVKVEANEEKGFNYDFYLRIPDTAIENQESHMLVEPNNSGRPNDDIDFHDQAAKNRAQYNQLVEELNVPLLIPVFPRSDQISFYTHALGKGNFEVSESKPYARLDQQLISMVDYARNILKMNGLRLDEKIFLNGFSASGAFVNRFAKVHPDRVRTVVAGGLSGMPLLPAEQYNEKSLVYPIGIEDFASLTGESFDIEAYKEVSKYYYMGYLDRNDGVGEIADEIFGDEIIYDRWEGAQEVYEEMEVPAQFVTYNNTYHEIKPGMFDDIVEFFKKNRGDEFVKIEPHQYEYVEYEELEELLIKDVIWKGDPEMPDEFAEQLKEDNNTDFVIIVEEILEEIDVSSQLYDFLVNAGFNFSLESSEETINIDTKNYNHTIAADGKELIAGYRIMLTDEEMSKINYDEEYDFVVHNNEDDNYSWSANKALTLTPVK